VHRVGSFSSYLLFYGCCRVPPRASRYGNTAGRSLTSIRYTPWGPCNVAQYVRQLSWHSYARVAALWVEYVKETAAQSFQVSGFLPRVASSPSLKDIRNGRVVITLLSKGNSRSRWVVGWAQRSSTAVSQFVHRILCFSQRPGENVLGNVSSTHSQLPIGVMGGSLQQPLI
jgi:hypothetical protein